MLVTEEKAAELLGTTSATLRVLRCRGEKPNGMKICPFIKMGRNIRYDTRDIDAYIDAHRVQPEVSA